VRRFGVVTGSRAEARCISGAAVFCSGGDPARAAAGAQSLTANGAESLLSFGIAAGLAPDLAPGTVVQADAVVLPDGTRIAAQSANAVALTGAIAGVDAPLLGPAGKAALHARTGALAADMESHVVAVAAQAAGVPFAVLRAVADPADRRVPAWALVGLGPDGALRPLAVLRGLVSRPGDLPALLRLARDSGAALAALRRVAQAL